jgi:hypothetical protein
MDHNYYKERISAYSDHALPPYEQMAVEGHLATCAECRAALEKIQKLSAWIGAEGNLGGDDYFEKQAQAIEERLGITQTKVTPVGTAKSWRGLGWELTAAAASIALVGILAFYTKDSIWQKTDQPVMSPSIIQKSIEPMSDTQSEQPLQKQAIPAPQIESETRSGPEQGQKTVKTEVIDSPRNRLPEEDVIAPEVDIKLDESQSNYKDVPQMLAPAQDAMPEVVKETKLAKPVELKQSDPAAAVPAPRADQLLESVAGVKAKSDSGVVIRGGRAGEMEYSIDSAPAKDSGAPINQARKDMVVRAKRDLISKSEVSGQLSKSAEKIAGAPTPPPDSLSYWRAIRDSLERENQPKGVVDRIMLQAKRPQPQGVATSLREEKDTSTHRVSPVEAYFRIAKLSGDSTEVSNATDSLKRFANDTKSPYQKTAQAYLDSLGVK